VVLGLEDGFNELEGTVWAVGKTRVEKKAKLKDRLWQAQARAAFEDLLPIVSPCDAKWAALVGIHSMCRTARVCEKQLLTRSVQRSSTMYAFITTLTTLSRDGCC